MSTVIEKSNNYFKKERKRNRGKQAPSEEARREGSVTEPRDSGSLWQGPQIAVRLVGSEAQTAGGE